MDGDKMSKMGVSSDSEREAATEEIFASAKSLSLKERRQQRHRKLESVTEHSSSDDSVATQSGQKRVKVLAEAQPSLPTHSLTPPPMSTSRAIPLLICSVGNPAPYLNTLHSAGHTALNRLAERLGYSPFRKDRSLGNGLVSTSASPGESNWTLWQSTSLMNVSGSGVRAAYNTWSKSLPDGEGKLVIVHDELEKPLGAVNLNVRRGASAKGHNGLKSIMSSLGGKDFVRIGVGIGRPVSRDSKDVAAYVLKKMTPEQRAKVEGSVEEIVAKLVELERG